MVVQDRHDDGQVVLYCGGQLLHVHLEAAVAGDVDNGAVRAGDLGANGGGKAVAHGAEAARGDEVAGLHEVVKLRGPHLVLAHLSGDDGVARRDLINLLADVLRQEFAIRILLVRQREIPLPLGDLRQPGRVHRIPILALHGPQLLEQALQAHLHVTDDRQGDGDVLADGGWINVDMDELGR